jgi:predicted AAA+ superfamily ATPase
MVFVAGPRQVGKTTLALSLPKAKPGYLNWDTAEHRERILRRELPDATLWIFDEIHKYRQWRNYLKGLYDNRRSGQCHLLKWVHYRQDVEGLDLELRYFRDTDGREVDFVIVEKRRPIVLVECKWSDADIDKSLRYLKAKFRGAEAWQISAVGTKDYVSGEGIRVAPAIKLLSNLI